jgi:phosphoglycolate phosphatase
VIFDLDGTLLDTLADLTTSANAMSVQYGFEEHSRDEIRSFVGNGIRKLIQRIVPGGEEHPQFEQIYESFRVYYGEHCMDETEPYPGILSLLDWLKKEGYRTAIVSNKADFAVKKLKEVYFGELVDTAIGEKDGCRRKPAPDSVLQALEELGIRQDRAVYVGDSDVDVMTAQNAQMDCIPVSWGFRSREFLIEHGAAPDTIAANVKELKEQLQTENR